MSDHLGSVAVPPIASVQDSGESFGGLIELSGFAYGGCLLAAIFPFRIASAERVVSLLSLVNETPRVGFQVTRRLRGPLDDDRRAVRQAAVKSRNVWFMLS